MEDEVLCFFPGERKNENLVFFCPPSREGTKKKTLVNELVRLGNIKLQVEILVDGMVISLCSNLHLHRFDQWLAPNR